jgi:carbon storage regulator CsrA
VLVLSRKPNERITIKDNHGNEIKLCLVRISKTGVSARIGIEAPREWNIVRDELKTEVQSCPQ